MNSVNSGSSAWVTFRDGFIAGHIGGAIGAGAAATGGAISAAGGGAMLAGAAGGAISGAGFSGLATDWDGQAMLQGAAYGAISGFAGAGVGAAIGGGLGAAAGGSVGSGINTALYGGSGEDVLKSALIGGVLAYGSYELTSYANWKSKGWKIGNHELSYKQHKTLQADFQRSRFWRKEYGGFLMGDGSVERFPADWRNSHGITNPDGGIVRPEGAEAMYHTHWDKPGRVIWTNSSGQRVDNSGDVFALFDPSVRQTTTARGHGAYDFLSFDSYVVNRYETTLNLGGTSVNAAYNDLFLRFFPWLIFR